MQIRMDKGKYDFGIATDGDSDRMALIDEYGNFVDANSVLKLLYYYLKEYRGRKGGIVRNLATTHILDRMAEHYDEPAYEVPVGFKHISRTMEDHDLLLGGESSGGLKIRGHINGKDGILASLLAVEMIARTGKKIGDILAEIDRKFGEFYFHTDNFEYDASERQRLEQLLFEDKHCPDFNSAGDFTKEADFKKESDFTKEIADIKYIDGVKYYFKDGSWVSIRFSGTEPLLRIYMEMNNQDEARAISEFLKKDLNI